MSAVANRVRSGFYLDSVALMRLSAALGAEAGIDEAVLMIGTETNRDLMRDAGLLTGIGEAAGPADLIIAVRAVDEIAAEQALELATTKLVAGRDVLGADTAARPRTIAGAIEVSPDANLALISVPGEFAAAEAQRALAAGLNVMLFSDNVSVDDEVRLKRDAAARGLLLMGPDCGTAWLAGTPLAFANRVRRGNIGLIAASGTGAQEVAVLLDRAGLGISHGLGVGGRDLSDAVGALSTREALQRLVDDPGTEHILLISKPPGSATARQVFEWLANCGKPASACLLGVDAALAAEAPIPVADTLSGAVAALTGTSQDEADTTGIAASDAQPGTRRTQVCGLYTGGTLAAEAVVVLARAGVAVGDDGHSVTDLGDDRFTRGRPHPMIEPDVRAAPLAAALADPDIAVVLLDVVLGLGAHADPAMTVIECMQAAGEDRPLVVAHVCGTDADPQNRSLQVAALEAAGVIVASTNAAGATLAARLARQDRAP